MQPVNTVEAIQSVGDRLVNDTIESQRKKGLRYKGTSAASLRAVVKASRSVKRLQIVGLARWRFQQNGRGPNKSQKPSRKMVEAITEWAVDHGMPETAGYPIALKIAREGILVPNQFNPGGVLSDPLNAKRVRGILKVTLRPQYIQQARSIMFST